MFSRKIVTDPEKIEEILTRGVTGVIEDKHLRQELTSGKKLRIKFGIDPTSPDLHLGHAVALRKLSEFQKLGHQIILLIGDFTATVGDPTGKSSARPPLEMSQVKKNMKGYLSQAGLILDLKKTKVVYNRKWLEKLPFSRIFELSGLVSVTQMLERDDFKKRLANQQSIRVHELFYPIMQAYDSVEIKADVELGGNDQYFNMLSGRTLMEKLGMKPQDIVTVALLEGTDGVNKMSKSMDNYIALTSSPSDMYGKVMSVRDELVQKYFLLCTDVQEKTINELVATLDPKSLKMRLAREIVALYHGESLAAQAEENFTKTFSEGKVPDKMPVVSVAANTKLADALVSNNILSSKTEFKRLVEVGAIKNLDTGEKIQDIHTQISAPVRLKIGKRTFIEIRPLA